MNGGRMGVSKMGGEEMKHCVCVRVLSGEVLRSDLCDTNGRLRKILLSHLRPRHIFALIIADDSSISIIQLHLTPFISTILRLLTFTSSPGSHPLATHLFPLAVSTDRPCSAPSNISPSCAILLLILSIISIHTSPLQ